MIMNEKLNVLLIGSGGREHAIANSIFDDKKMNKLFCAPGNAGTRDIAENVILNIMDNNEIYDFVKKQKIDFIIVGPEQPLENGIVDYFKNKDIKVFGPCSYAAQLETSKLFARNIMEEYEIPQPAFFECSNQDQILEIRDKIGLPLVLKADGLAAGKGVIICRNDAELENAIEIMLNQKKFGSASDKISVEECLVGEELSVFAICDGLNFKFINSAQDHKRIYDNDKGPNTGGMGAYCPAPLFTEELKNKVEKSILIPILQAMNDKGAPFKGFLYIGLMINQGMPYVIEFNVRLGDPEAQVLLPLIESSLFDMMLDSVDGNIKEHNIILSSDYAVTVVLASKGYPEKYNKNMKIEGLNNLDNELVFHAGTKYKSGTYYANGGRVLNVVGKDKDLIVAKNKAYSIIKKINFENKYYRTDISDKGIDKLKHD